MRSHFDDDWIWKKRRTVVVFRDSPGRHEALQGEAFMLWQDAQNRIMPIGGRSQSRPEFAITWEPQNAAWETLLLAAIRTYEAGRHSSLTPLVCQFVQEVTGTLMLYGQALYEVVQGDTNEHLTPQKQFALLPFPGHHVRRHRKGYIQEGPVHTTSDPKEGVQHVELQEQDVFRLELPKSLGSPRTQGLFLRTVAELNALPLRWTYDGATPESARSAFSFEEYRRQSLATLARVTLPWGWDARSLWGEEALEFFQVHRMVRFRRSLAFLREHIVSELNGQLATLGAPGQLKVSGLPTSAELDDVRLALEAGRISFGEALQRSDIF